MLRVLTVKVKQVTARLVNFEISNRNGAHTFMAEGVYAVDKLKVAANPKLEDLPMESWPHLQGLKFADVPFEEITVLIGEDNEEAHDYYEKRRPAPEIYGPTAILTKYGWCLGGKLGPLGRESQEQAEIFVTHISTGAPEVSLIDLIHKFWSIDSQQLSSGPVLSEEDQWGKQILESTIKNVGNRYQVGLMWKSDVINLPDNRMFAL